MYKIIFFWFFSIILQAGFDNNIHGLVLSIADGDTIRVLSDDGEEFKVRLYGIDTPELNFNGHSQGFYAEEARTFLQETIPLGSEVTVRYNGDDDYGRILGVVFSDTLDINKKLLEEGLACLYMIYPYNPDLIEEYVSVAQDAEMAELGMFAGIEYLPYVFRLKISNKVSTRYVGNFLTKKFYKPSDQNKVPSSLRIFFIKKSDAIHAGYDESESF